MNSAKRSAPAIAHRSELEAEEDRSGLVQSMCDLQFVLEEGFYP